MKLSLEVILCIPLILYFVLSFIFRNKIYQFYNSSFYKKGKIVFGYFGYFLLIGLGVGSIYTFITTYPEDMRLQKEVEKTKIEDITSVELEEANFYATFNLIDTSVVISDRSQIKIFLNGVQSAKLGHSNRNNREWKVKLRLNYKNNTYKQFLVERIERNGPIYICLLRNDTGSEAYRTQVSDLDFVLLLNNYRKREEYN